MRITSCSSQMDRLCLLYEQLPPFCNHCGIVGHSLDSCRSVKGRKGEKDINKMNKLSGKQLKNKQKEGDWV